MPRVAAAISSFAFKELARRQNDVVSRRQLRQINVTWQHVEARIRAGSLQAIGSFVVALHGAARSPNGKSSG